LVPSYTKPDVKPDHFRMFNARSDDMKPVFTRLLKHRRCVVLLDGFYEWKKVRLPGTK
jgi:putative SOS response-associated peptidase YedK